MGTSDLEDVLCDLEGLRGGEGGQILSWCV